MMQVRDFRRLLIILFAAVVVGWLFDNVILSLLIAISAYCFWLQRNIGQLLKWIQDRKNQLAPDPPGVFEDLCREIDYSRERHRKRKKKLGDYIKQFQLATRALPDGTVVLDESGSVSWANKAAAEFLGIKWPDDAGQRITNLIRLPEIAEIVRAESDRLSIDIASPTKANTQLNVRLTPFGNKQRLFVARDITQMHRSDQIRRDFVANVSHELRTPITVLRGYLENMSARKDQCPPAWQNPMEHMINHVTRMQSIVEDLLTLSQLEQKDDIDHPVSVPVAKLIADIHRQSQSLNATFEHKIVLEIEPELRIYGSDKDLHSCFSNLVYNAINYSGKQQLIEIRWYHDENGAHFEVKDSGPGIEPQHLERLTERFYRVDKSRDRAHGGTGLGLAIVKHVLTRHDARLHIESELDKGSTFRCDFPNDSIAESAAGNAVRERA
jgi:two-component system phosphate regulon sensor histidine kinase PhoR